MKKCFLDWNRKKRKALKMKYRRQGLKILIPTHDSIITCAGFDMPSKSAYRMFRMGYIFYEFIN